MEFEKGTVVVNADGWICKVLNGNTGMFSPLFNKGEVPMIEVEVTGYSELIEKYPVFWVDDLKEHYPIGKKVISCDANFRPYPEYKGFECGSWVK